MAPVALYTAANLTATATDSPPIYTQAPLTAWTELAGRAGVWLGLIAAVVVALVLIRLRRTRRGA